MYIFKMTCKLFFVYFMKKNVKQIRLLYFLCIYLTFSIFPMFSFSFYITVITYFNRYTKSYVYFTVRSSSIFELTTICFLHHSSLYIYKLVPDCDCTLELMVCHQNFKHTITWCAGTNYQEKHIFINIDVGCFLGASRNWPLVSSYWDTVTMNLTLSRNIKPCIIGHL